MVNTTRVQSPWRAVLLAIIWMVASFLATGAVIVGLLVLSNRAILIPPRLAIDQAGGFVGEAMLLLVALRFGGLGAGAVHRRRLIAGLTAAPPLAMIALIALIAQLPGATEALRPMITPGASETLDASPLLLATGMGLTVILAPVAEELFFRGWLWARLRPHWRPLATGACTGILFMLLHLTGGLLKPLFVLPTTVLLTLARHYGGSVKASLLVHISNNATVAAMLLLARSANG